MLIIDDDISTVRLIAESLQAEFSVNFATTGAKGLSLAEKMPDVILLDLNLPDMKGFEVIKKLKQNPSTYPIPVIFISSVSDLADQERGFRFGAVDYVVKPIQVPLLRMRIKAHAKLYQQAIVLEQLAATDFLTNVANRRKFNDVLGDEVKRSYRDGSSISLLMIDVDDFKLFNDYYGHGKGDECLVCVAKILREVATRSSDCIARVGGEEFAMILPDSSCEGAEVIARNINQLISQAGIEHEFSKHDKKVTVSIGIRNIKPGEKDSQKSIYNEADKALYQAKTAGKNTYWVYR